MRLAISPGSVVTSEFRREKPAESDFQELRAVGQVAVAFRLDDDDVFQPLVGWIGTFDLTSDPELVGVGIEALRVFSGYAGWEAGQLEAECEGGWWWVVDAHPADLMCERPDGLWRHVLARHSDADLRRFALYPADPRAN